MTGKEYLAKHAIDENEMNDDGDDIDIMSHIKVKNIEEEKIDEENAKLAEILAKEVEKELQQEKSEKSEKDQITIEEPKIIIDNAALKEDQPNDTIALVGVDTSLFVGDDGDLGDVEFSDEI